MLTKKLMLLAALLTAVSCSSHKKNSETAAVQTKSEPAQVQAAVLYSVPAAEVKNSESGAHVVYFATNSFGLDAKAVEVLSQKVLPEAKNDKAKKVVIEAHCDERGSKAHNQKLSVKRANAVKEYLVKNGIKNAKIKTVGFGESKPVALGHDEESWAKNRRAVTIVIKK